MRIGLATAHDPCSRLTWSGTPSFMADALSRHGAEVVPLGPINVGLELPVRAVSKLSERLLGRRMADRHFLPLARAYGRRLTQKAAQAKVDVVFAPAGSQLLAYADLEVPVVYSSDATFALMTEYYPDFTRLYGFSRAQGERVEARAIARSDLLLYPSNWAATSALRDYGAEPWKVRVLPYGANLPEPPPDRHIAARNLQRTGVRMLFVGVDWTRKGGDTALATLVALEARGVRASLTVCGCTPTEVVPSTQVDVRPFVEKTGPEGAAKIAELYAAHDLLLFPTRREAYGIVVAEASAFGVPTIARATGGVSGVLRHDVNGYLLPEHADCNAFADAIAALVENPGRYAALCHSSRELYEQTLNWDAWASGAIDEIGRWSETPGARRR